MPRSKKLILSFSEDDDDTDVQNTKIDSLAAEGRKVAGQVEILESKVNTMVAHSNALEMNLITVKGHNKILEADKETLKGQVTILEGRVDNLTAENVKLVGRVDNLTAENVKLVGRVDNLTAENVKLVTDNDEERRYRACTEIAFGIQDINAYSSLENNSFVVRKGLSSTFRRLRKKRQDDAHLFLNDDLPDTLLFKKDAFKRILDNSSCLAVELKKKGITEEIIDVVIFELKKDLKDVSFATPIEADVNDVDDFFRNTLKTLDKRGIQQLQ